MKSFLSIIGPLLFISIACTETNQKIESDSEEDLVLKLKPENSTLTHKVIKSKWNDAYVTIAFYEQPFKENEPDADEHQRIIGNLFIQNNNLHKKILIDTIWPEGGDPKVESVFFTNADKDKEKEMIIIASWPQRHHGLVDGTLFNTFVYDNISTNRLSNLTYLKNISEKLSGGCDCEWSDGTSKTVKLKTAEAIKDELKRLGY